MIAKAKCPKCGADETYYIEDFNLEGVYHYCPTCEFEVAHISGCSWDIDEMYMKDKRVERIKYFEEKYK